MRDDEIRKQIRQKRAEMDHLLAKGDFEAYLQISKEAEAIWIELLNKDSGLHYLYTFINIWRKEAAKGDQTIMTGVKSVADVVQKYRNIRHAMMRLENDFPDDLCLEAISNLAEMKLSNTAFYYLLPRVVENEEKVIKRIDEISAHASI